MNNLLTCRGLSITLGSSTLKGIFLRVLFIFYCICARHDHKNILSGWTKKWKMVNDANTNNYICHLLFSRHNGNGVFCNYGYTRPVDEEKKNEHTVVFYALRYDPSHSINLISFIIKLISLLESRFIKWKWHLILLRFETVCGVLN